MKKILTLLLIMVAFVGQTNAWTNLWIVCDLNHWGWVNDTYNASNICVDSYKFTRDGNDDFHFTLAGTNVNSGDFYFRFYVYDDLGAGKHEVGPTNFTENTNADVTLSTTKATTTNYDNIQDKSFRILQSPNASEVDIYVCYKDNQWCITAAPIEDKYSITFDKSKDGSSSSWSTCNCYAYTGDHVFNKAWPGTPMTSSSTNVYQYDIPSNATYLIFNNGSSGDGNQSYDISDIVKNGVYKYTGIDGVTANISSTGYATFSSTKAIDFTDEPTIEACKASVGAGGNITYTKVTSVAANEGVLLRRADGTIASASSIIPLHATPSVAANESNDFVGITVKQLLAQTANSKTNYILTTHTSTGDGPLGFYKVNHDGSWCAAGTAYLATSVTSGSARDYFPLWDDVAPVESIVKGVENTNLPVYDLQGRCVANPQKGLYIVNGKKVVIK